jgi:hypothetical protein
VSEDRLRSIEVPLDRLAPGVQVDVLSALGSWSRGFEIADVVFHNGDIGYRLRRMSDGAVLPVTFATHLLVRSRG